MDYEDNKVGSDDAEYARHILGNEVVVQVLVSLDPDARQIIDPLVAAQKAHEEAEQKRRKAEQEKRKAEQEKRWEEEMAQEPPLPRRGPDQTRAVALVNTRKLDQGIEYWLAWDDDSLRALPLDLQQAWAEGPRAWEAALWGTHISYYEPPHDYPVGIRADLTFRDAVNRYMKAHLSAEDYAWYLAGERVGTMRDEAQAAWKKGSLAWAAFLAPPRPPPAP